MSAGVLPFELRFHVLVVASSFCIVQCVASGYSLADLGLAERGDRRHWVSGGLLSVFLIAVVYLEARMLASSHSSPDWRLFAPFYVFISSPCQEIVCRAAPRLLAEQVGASGPTYVLFSSVAFSLMHAAYGDPLLLINTFLAGVAWSTDYLLTRNLWPLIASHAAVGTFAFWIGVA
jgi:membrane protease YdiL (CAAX protease family)